MDKPLQPIPRLLNQPEKIAFWTWNEIILFLSIFLGIWSVFSFLLGLVIGAMSIRLMRLLKNSPYGDLTKIGMYWFSPWSEKQFKTLPPSHIREYIG